MVNTDLQKKKMVNWPTSAILAASKGENLEQDTYNAPPPAGPAALKRDIAVMAMPLAAPLWC